VAEHRPDIIRHSVKINRLMAEKDYQPTEEQIQRALERAFKFLQEKE
jgi:hypothetical protein